MEIQNASMAGISAGKAVKMPKVSELEQELSRMSNANTNLRESISVLASRLSPLMVPETPVEEGLNEIQPSTELAKSLREKSDDIARLNNWVLDILNRLEI